MTTTKIKHNARHCNFRVHKKINAKWAIYHNQAYSEYNHVLANILRSRYVARTPPLEARSQAAAVMLRTPPSPASHRIAARTDPAERSHYVVISRDGRKLITRVRVMLP